MPHLTIIRGLPGSGKSTMAKAMVAESAFQFVKTLHFEADMFFDTHEGYMFDASKLKDAHSWCQACVKASLAEGHNVVVSNTFTQHWEMQPYKDMVSNDNLYIVVAKGEFQNVHNVPAEAIERMKQRWQE